jgi:hypothetical protein
MASFVLPEVNDDPEGWGPASNSVPEHLKYLVRPCCRAGALPASPLPRQACLPTTPAGAQAGGRGRRRGATKPARARPGGDVC